MVAAGAAAYAFGDADVSGGGGGGGGGVGGSGGGGGDSSRDVATAQSMLAGHIVITALQLVLTKLLMSAPSEDPDSVMMFTNGAMAPIFLACAARESGGVGRGLHSSTSQLNLSRV